MPKDQKRPRRTSSSNEASRRLLAANERELQRIVLDMHDGPVQDIFAAVSQLEVLDRQLGQHPASQQRARQALMALERALSDIREFIGAFRPPGFERRSLGAIIEGLTVQHETLTGQVIALELSPNLGDCGLATKIALYRILQESLANGYRHSGATRQQVVVRRVRGKILLTVADDGRGFDPEQVLAREEHVGVEGGHFGLRGIQDRVAMLGGKFSLTSAPGEGSAMTISVAVE